MRNGWNLSRKESNILILKTKERKNQFIDDLIWLIDMAEKEINRKKEKPQWKMI